MEGMATKMEDMHTRDSSVRLRYAICEECKPNATCFLMERVYKYVLVIACVFASLCVSGCLYFCLPGQTDAMPMTRFSPKTKG